jgi:hypothetical protein
MNINQLQAEIEATQSVPVEQQRQYPASPSSHQVATVNGAEMANSKPQAEDATAAMKALQQQVTSQPKRIQSFPVKQAQAMLLQSDTDELQRLEMQANQVNQLASELENAIVELKAIASEVNPTWKANQPPPTSTTRPNPASSEVCEYLAVVVPQVRQKQNGAFVLTVRSIDLFKPEREAASTAQALRHWGNQRVEQPQPHRQKLASRRQKRSAKSVQHSPKTRFSFSWKWLKRFLQPPQTTSALVRDAIAWTIAAAVLRVGVDFLLAAFPSFWPPVALLLVTPAMIAACLTTLMPQAGFTLGYRLLLILFGLLLGGRL